ncbi:sensor histidine kinase [Gracilimonas sp.]|uniref:sensor histidine kinase n=1 Tax=Gracilimonas sp. TaxID=1974203 RepID=UPI002871C996|nr:histidine kinase dimerization/phosphoacceptor domain -containing protein [Gracilimonas sp.]
MDNTKVINSSPVIITLGYLLVGALWIQFSDQIVLDVLDDPELITQVQSYKGWFFVLMSGIVIFLLIKKNNSLLGDVISELEKSRDKFKATFDFAPLGIAHHRPNENWIQVNQTLCDLLGYRKEELLQLGFEDFIHPDDLKAGRKLDSKLAKQEMNSYKIEKRYQKKDGSYFPGRVSKSVVTSKGRESQDYMVVMLEDITKQKEAQNALKEALQEKTVLLGEIHHRVRNNLALISALFDLQAMYIEDDRVHAILKDSHMRIKCLAMIHESYAEAEKTSDINFGQYLQELVDFVEHTFSNENVKIEKEIPPIEMNINQAVPAGLLCNELLLNAYLNSYEQVENPVIRVSLNESEKKIYLSVSDNGVNSRGTYELEKPNSLGMLIIKTLSNQLRGDLHISEEEGKTTFKLEFKKRNLKGPSSAL